jgi:predicted class III extradiol MEMO1 family dioxygenase
MTTQARWILLLRACCSMGLQERRLGQRVRLPPPSTLQSTKLISALSKRVFLLGPSHHYYLSGAATTSCTKYGTPLGDLIVDTALVQEIQQKWSLETMSRRVDEDEHSLEMHLPYIYKMLSLYVNSPAYIKPIHMSGKRIILTHDLSTEKTPHSNPPLPLFPSSPS